MAGAHQQRVSVDEESGALWERADREILFPDGYELAYYTLRRVHDGHLQSFLPVNTGATSVQAVLIDAQLSDIQALEGLQANQEGPESGSLVPVCSSNHVPNE